MPRVFLLSPANSAGQRAGLMLRPQAAFPLALRLRSTEGASLGEVFQFTSGLYFRGKRAYAHAFGKPPKGAAASLTIVPGFGLLPTEQRIRHHELVEFGKVPV